MKKIGYIFYTIGFLAIWAGAAVYWVNKFGKTFADVFMGILWGLLCAFIWPLVGLAGLIAFIIS